MICISFRNDHDAAVSRIAALEHELCEARRNSERDGLRIEALEREIAAMRRHDTAVRAPIEEPRGWLVVPIAFALVVVLDAALVS